MFSLQRLFALVGSFGIVGPHDGHEAALLLAGKKPVGLFSMITPFPDETIDQTETERDIAMLDKAVSEGRLSKHLVVEPPQKCWGGRGGTAHFYCQKGAEDDMLKVAAFHQAIWEGREEEADLPKDCGLYFGYTDEDVRLFQRGGYDSLPLLPRILMKSTHQLRQRARLAAAQCIEPSGPSSC